MNILFTNFCNISCPYCFAKGKLISSEDSKNSYITLENLRTIIDFLKKSKETHVSIVGGEPTLHPEFKKAVTMILDEGFNITIFSNGIMRDGVIAFLRGLGKNRWVMLLNINEPRNYPKKEWSRINKTMKVLNQQIEMGFTIYKTGFSADFIFELIEKYGLRKRIRLGIGVPIYGQNNAFLSCQDHRKVAPKIVRFAEKGDALDISIRFDCGFVLCSFTEKECDRLHYYNSPLETSCPGPIDVGPDLSLWRCFAISKLWNKTLGDFDNLDDIRKFYNNKFKRFQRVGVFDKCIKCNYLIRGQCSGGCLGHILKTFNIGDRRNVFSENKIQL